MMQSSLYIILYIAFSIILWYYLPVIAKIMKHDVFVYIWNAGHIKLNRSEIPEFWTK